MLFIYLAMLENAQERQTLSEFYEQNKFLCLHVALKITHNQMMAEDAIHNAFLEVIKNKEKYFVLSNKEFRSRIVIIVKNKCIDLLRKNKKIVPSPVEEIEPHLDSKEIPVDIQYIIQEDYEHLIQLISQLDELSIRILEMKYLLDMSYKEISAALDITPKNVEMRIYRAKQKLWKMSEKENSCHE